MQHLLAALVDRSPQGVSDVRFFSDSSHVYCDCLFFGLHALNSNQILWHTQSLSPILVYNCQIFQEEKYTKPNQISL